MNTLRSFNDFISENYSENNLIVYHGARTPHDFSDTGYISNGTFFADEIEVAESFGNFIYEVVLYNDVDIFDSTSLSSANMLLEEFSYLYDKPYNKDERIELQDAESIANNKDTWEIIENNEGVLDWIIEGGYEGVRLREKGNITYLLFNPSACIKSSKIIHTLRD